MKRMLLGAALFSAVIGIMACAKRDPVSNDVTVSFTNEIPSNAEQIAIAGNVVLTNETSNTTK
jgi:hypothetical protein